MNVSLYRSFKDLPKKDWSTLLTEKDFFLSTQCLQVIEAEHSKEIEPLYFIFRKNKEIKGILYAQIFHISGPKLNEYIQHGQGNKCILKSIQQSIINRIDSKVAFLGNLFLSNEESFKFLDDFKDLDFLLKVTELINTKTRAKHILIPEFFSSNIDILGARCKKISVEPDMHFKLNESWTKFDDYLEEINSKYKKRYRKVMRNSAAITKRELSATELKESSEILKILFDNVYYKSKFNAAKFNTDVFFDLKLTSKDVTVHGYFLDNKMIGFQSDIQNNKELFAHFVGIDYNYNKDLDLYNRMLYEQIRFAIDNNLSVIKFGRTASEFKSTIGATPHVSYGYVYHPSKSIMLALSPILKLIKPKDWTQRQPFKTKKPSN